MPAIFPATSGTGCRATSTSSLGSPKSGRDGLASTPRRRSPMIHTCPRCELRFASDTELTDHLKIDHHADPEEFDRLHYKPKPVRPHGKRYLLLANRTL